MSDQGSSQSDNQDTGNEVDIESTVIGILNKHNSPNEAVETLLKDNFKLRERNRDLSSQVQTLRDSQTEPEDHTEELARLAEYQTIGTVDDIKSRFQQHEADKREGTLLRVSQTENVDFDVLKTLDNLNPNMVFSFKDVDGKSTTFVNVDNEEIAFNDFVKDQWGKFAPALRQGTGVNYPEQKAGSKQASRGSLVDAFIQGKNAHRDQSKSS